jgi:hypothetical protein
MQTANPLYVRTGTARITHIDHYFFYIYVLHGYILFDCDDIR